MRVFAQCAAVGILAAGIVAPGWPVAAQAPASARKDAASVLAAARKALGGESKLSAVKSFTATGRTRQVRGDSLVPIEFEIFVELPDKYLRKDEIPAQESGPTASGFNGDELLQDPPPAAPPAVAPGRAAGPGTPAGPNPMDAMRRTRVNGLKQDFARLALGMFAGAYPSYPLTFTYVGEAEAPQGKADVVDAKGPDNLTLRFFINSETHLPIMVTWTPPAPAGRGARPGGPGPAGPGAPGATAAPGGRGGPPAAAGATPATPGATPPPNVAPPPGGAQPPPAGTQPPPAGAPRPGAAPPAGAAPPTGTAPPTAGAPPSAAPPTGAAPPPGVAPPPGAGAQPAGRGSPGGLPGAGPGAAPGAAAPPRPELRLYFADYRDVDGMQFPFRLRRATGTDTTEETTFDRYRVNVKIDPRKFEVRK